MKYLIDTHTFLWFLNNDEQLSNTARTMIETADKVLISIGSLWEIAIKYRLGKLALPADFEAIFPHQLTVNRIEVLAIEIPHLYHLNKLDFHHRDPFDRLIIAQALAEDLPIISKDGAFQAYDVRCFW